MSASRHLADPSINVSGKTTTINQASSDGGDLTTNTETANTTMAPPLPSATPQSRLYFAYGSNLSTTQMADRCPDAKPKHLGWIGGWSFIINQRGFANIVPDADFDTNDGTGRQQSPGVFGVLYEISGDDGESLDVYEGVPHAYEKLELVVSIRHRGGGGPEQQLEGGWTGEDETLERVALVYVDRKRTRPSAPRPEYVRRMNRGIREASTSDSFAPLPGWYVKEVMRPFIPELEG